jgi:hypothetical protein
VPQTKNIPHAKAEMRYFIGRVMVHPKQLHVTEKGKIPEEYQ